MRELDSIFTRPPDFITEPPDFDRLTTVSNQMLFGGQLASVSGQEITSDMIRRTMEKINAALPPRSDRADRIECSGDLYEALRRKTETVNAMPLGLTGVWILDGLPIIFDPTLRPGTFLAHMLDGSSVMHYPGRKKVRCLNCDDDLLMNGDPSKPEPQGVIQVKP